MKELPGARYWWLKDLFKEIGGGDSIPKDFGKDLGRSREVFDRLLHNQGTKYYNQVESKVSKHGLLFYQYLLALKEITHERVQKSYYL